MKFFYFYSDFYTIPDLTGIVFLYVIPKFCNKNLLSAVKAVIKLKKEIKEIKTKKSEFQ